MEPRQHVTDHDILFEEHQHFRQIWLWLILFIVQITSFSGLYIQFQKGGSITAFALWVGPIITLVIIALFVIIRLDTVIKKDGIYVRFFPVHLKFKKYSVDKLAKIHIRKYKPLLEYGGWGIRYGFSGKAYNISGNKGIQLVLKDGSKLLIGTRDDLEAEEALKQLNIDS